MYKYMLLIILSLGIHGHFVPLKITTSHLQHNDINTIVKEIVYLLNNISVNVKERFTTPVNITCQNCSHKYTKVFISELCKVSECKIVRLSMEKLEKHCPFLQKNIPGNHENCETVETDFSNFKNNLKTFVCWVNEKNICNTTQEDGQRQHVSPQYSCADEKNY